MTKKQNIQKIKEYVYNLLKNDTTGHDFYHIQRVVCLVKKICVAENIPLDYPVLLAYLHDVGDYKLHQGKDQTAVVVRDILQKTNAEESWIKQVIADIQLIGFKGGFNQHTNNLSVWVVQDADRLDAMGAIGIARAFAYGGSKGRLLHDPEYNTQTMNSAEQYQTSIVPTIQHFYDKLLRLKDLMKTETAKVLAEERHDFMLQFLKQFEKEWKI